MNESKIGFFVLFFSAIMIACSGDDNDARRVPVNIILSEIPSDGGLDEDTQIQLKAQANNGCYSNLEVELKEIDSRHFLLEATGRVGGNNKCPQVLIDEDTVIIFRTETAGEYLFQVNNAPFEVRNYSLEIQ